MIENLFTLKNWLTHDVSPLEYWILKAPLSNQAKVEEIDERLFGVRPELSRHPELLTFARGLQVAQSDLSTIQRLTGAELIAAYQKQLRTLSDTNPIPLPENWENMDCWQYLLKRMGQD